jgi:hypothetical protein
LEAEWHFFATFHEKEPCDGVGGIFKRHVTRASLQQIDTHIHTPEDMFSFCVENITGIHFICVHSKDITGEEIKFADRFAYTTTVPNTRELHCFIPTGTNEIIIQCVSSSTEYTQWSAYQ